MASTSPKMDLRLWADRVVYLSRQQRFSLVAFVTVHSEKPVTIIKHAGEFDSGMLNLLISDIIECFDTDSGESTPVFDAVLSQQLGKLNRENISLMSLENRRAQYITFTTAKNPREYEFSFDVGALRPNRTYTIRGKSSALKWWSYDSKEKILKHYASHGKLPLTEIPALLCEAGNTVYLHARAEVPQPPKVDVSLYISRKFSLSNNPPFEFSICFISHASKPITVLAERHRIKAEDNDFEIINSDTGKRVAPEMIDCGDIGGRWQREDFLRLDPGVPRVEQRTLNPLKPYSGLENLKLDAEYSFRLCPSRWVWWSFDDVDEVMRYAGERDTGALGEMPSIDLVCKSEKVFRVVS